MAHYIRFESKETGKAVKFPDIDDAMRVEFGVEQDEEVWYKHWYDTICLCLAAGLSYDKLKTEFPDKLDVIEYLEKNFNCNTWRV